VKSKEIYWHKITQIVPLLWWLLHWNI